MSGALKLAAAGAIAALFVGSMLTGVLTSPTSGGAGTGDSGAVEPAIHWRSDIVDLRADGMTLQIGDEVYTTEGVEVVVDAWDGDLHSWSLYPQWTEDGQGHRLRLYFNSDGRTWALEPSLDFDSTAHTAPAPEGAILPSLSHSVDFLYQKIEVPLGEPLTGDLRLESYVMVETCESADPVQVAVALTFEALRIVVSPRDQSILDWIGDRLFHRGSLLGDLIDSPPDRPSARVLDCPDPTADLPPTRLTHPPTEAGGE